MLSNVMTETEKDISKEKANEKCAPVISAIKPGIPWCTAWNISQISSMTTLN